MCVCVCVCVCIYTSPAPHAGCDTRSILKLSTGGLNSVYCLS